MANRNLRSSDPAPLDPFARVPPLPPLASRDADGSILLTPTRMGVSAGRAACHCRPIRPNQLPFTVNRELLYSS